MEGSRPGPILNNSGFAEYTVRDRLPTIVRRILEENPSFPFDVKKALEELKESIPEGKIIPISDVSDDDEAWRKTTAPFRGKTWLEAPFLFAEAYLYRRILQLTRYFDSSAETFLVDPYDLQKRDGLRTSTAAIRPLADHINEAVRTWEVGKFPAKDFQTIFHRSLWGNKADLSLWPAKDGTEQSQHTEELDHILVDNTAEVIDYVRSLQGIGRLDLMVDNAGFELVCDLCLADYAVSCGMFSVVRFLLKGYPVHVSDALQKDVMHTIRFVMLLGGECEKLAQRWLSHLADGRWILTDHRFWSGGQALWEMPSDLAVQFRHTALLVIKGDANYRRLVGDLKWPFTTSLQEVCRYMAAPFVTLRTLKSEVCVGLSHGQQEEIEEKDAQWLSNGQWGLVQFLNVRK